jgi:uncharacterized protein YjbJ (UPF0337 family)
MSCGPADLVKELSANVEQLLTVADTALVALPLKISSIPGYVEAQLLTSLQSKIQLLNQLLEDPLAALGGAIPGLPNDIKGFVDQYAGVAAGVAGSALYLNNLKDKYGDLDVDIDNIVGVLNEAGNDLEKICEIVPNIQDIGGEFVLKGIPLSMPEINVKRIVAEGKFPDVVGNFKDAAGKVDVQVELDQDKQGFTVSQEPGQAFRMNGVPRFARKRNISLDSLTGGNPFGALKEGAGGNLFGDILDKVQEGLDTVESAVDTVSGN